MPGLHTRAKHAQSAALKNAVLALDRSLQRDLYALTVKNLFAELCDHFLGTAKGVRLLLFALSRAIWRAEAVFGCVSCYTALTPGSSLEEEVQQAALVAL